MAQDAFVRHIARSRPIQLSACARSSWRLADQIALNVGATVRRNIGSPLSRWISRWRMPRRATWRATLASNPRRWPSAPNCARHLERSLLHLPDHWRIPVVLRHVEGFTYQEIAQLLDQPPGTIKSAVHRGTTDAARIVGSRARGGVVRDGTEGNSSFAGIGTRAPLAERG